MEQEWGKNSSHKKHLEENQGHFNLLKYLNGLKPKSFNFLKDNKNFSVVAFHLLLTIFHFSAGIKSLSNYSAFIHIKIKQKFIFIMSVNSILWFVG